MAYTKGMRFIRQGVDRAAEQMVHVITSALDGGQKVLWLVSGGLNIPIEAETMRLVHGAASNEQNLSILPVDERFGPDGHDESNYTKLARQGFEPGQARWYNILAENLSFEETYLAYLRLAEELFSGADYVVATLGIGTDGHTAGLLPNTPAIAEAQQLVSCYPAADFNRLTLTRVALDKVDIAFLNAYGPHLTDALHRLSEHNETVASLPAAILYDMRDVYVYNDAIESEG